MDDDGDAKKMMKEARRMLGNRTIWIRPRTWNPSLRTRNVGEVGGNRNRSKEYMGLLILSYVAYRKKMTCTTEPFRTLRIECPFGG